MRECADSRDVTCAQEIEVLMREYADSRDITCAQEIEVLMREYADSRDVTNRYMFSRDRRPYEGVQLTLEMLPVLKRQKAL